MTRGQFGSYADAATSNSTYGSLGIGGSWRRERKVRLGADLTCTTAEEAMERFGILLPPDAAARLVDSSYDWSEVHTYSDLDSLSVNLLLAAEANLTRDLLLTATYERSDFTDDAPYLDDLEGDLSTLRLGLRYIF